MEESDIKKLIDSKIRDAKLDEVWEKRFRFYLIFIGALVASLGVILPLYQVDKAKEDIYRTIQQIEE